MSKCPDQINIKLNDQIREKLDIIKEDTGFGITTLFNQWTENEYNKYYRNRSNVTIGK